MGKRGIFLHCFVLSLVGIQFGSEAAKAYLLLQQFNDTVYIAERSFPTLALSRCHLPTQSWSPLLQLPNPPTALLVVSNACYVACQQDLWQYSLDLTNAQQVFTAPGTIQALYATPQAIVLLTEENHLLSLSRETHTLLASNVLENFSAYKPVGPQNALYGVRDGKLVKIELTEDGRPGREVTAPFSMPFASQARVFETPKGLVLTSQGVVFREEDLRYVGRIIPFQWLAWNQYCLLVVSLKSNLVLYNWDLLPIGHSPTISLYPLFSNYYAAIFQDQVFIFPIEYEKYTIVKPISQYLHEATSSNGEDPTDFVFAPTWIDIDPEGILLLYDDATLTLYRWSIPLGRYLPPIPLPCVPRDFAYAPSLQRLYILSKANQIEVLDLQSEPGLLPAIQPVWPPCNIRIFDDFLLTQNSGIYYLYDLQGNLLRQWQDNVPCYHAVFSWNSAYQTLYFIGENAQSERNLFKETIRLEGSITNTSSPLPSLLQLQAPILVDPNNCWLVLGSGQVLQTTSLIPMGYLQNQYGNTNRFQDGVWIGNDLFTLRFYRGGSQIQRWTLPDFHSKEEVRLEGRPVCLLQWEDKLVAVTLREEGPLFYLLNTNLDFLIPLPPSKVYAVQTNSDSITVGWDPADPEVKNYTIEILDPQQRQWTEIARVPQNQNQYVIAQLATDTLYKIRIRPEGSWLSSSPIAVRTLPDPRLPTPPADFHVAYIRPSLVKLRWEDRAANETYYLIERLEGDSDHWEQLALLPADTTSFVDTNVVAYVTYSYRITAGNDFGLAPSPTIVTVRIPYITICIGGALSVTLTPLSQTSVLLEWKDSNDGQLGYRIYRAVGTSTNWVFVGEVEGTARRFIDTGLIPNTTYTYQISRLCPKGEREMHCYPPPVITTPPVGGIPTEKIVEHKGIVYFFMQYPSRIERYDLQKDQWLSPIPSPASITTFTVSDAGIYIATTNRLFWVSFDGMQQREVCSFESALIDFLVPLKGYLLIGLFSSSGTELLTMDCDSEESIHSAFLNVGKQYSASRPHFLLFTGSSTWNQHFVTVAHIADGGILDQIRTISITKYQDRIWIDPEEKFFLTDSGHLFSMPKAGSLSEWEPELLGTIGESLDHAAFLPDGRILGAVGQDLTLFGTDYLPHGRLTLPDRILSIQVVSTNRCVVFYPSKENLQGIEVKWVDLDEIPPLRPSLVSYPKEGQIDEAYVTRNNLLILWNKEAQIFYRYDLRNRTMLPPIPLLGIPQTVLYSRVKDRFYLVYPYGQITQLDPNGENLEKPFVNTYGPGGYYVAVGDQLLVEEGNHPQRMLVIFDAEGRRHPIPEKSIWVISKNILAVEEMNRVFFIGRDGVLHSLEILEGQTVQERIGTDNVTLPHCPTFALPIYGSTNTPVIITQLGEVFDQETLNLLRKVSSSIDVAWWGDFGYILCNYNNRIERWDVVFQNLQLSRDLQEHQEQPLRLFSWEDGLVLISKKESYSSKSYFITYFDPDLRIQYHQSLPLTVSDFTLEFSGLSIPENATPGTRVGKLIAKGPYEGATHQFTLLGEAAKVFQLDGDTLVVKQPLDYETTPEFPLEVQIVDSFGFTTQKTIKIPVQDVNEPPTNLVLQPSFTLLTAPPGTILSTVHVEDPEPYDTSTISLGQAHQPVEVFDHLLALQKPLSAVAPTGTLSFPIVAKDSADHQIQRQVSLQILTVESNIGETLLTFSVPEKVRTNVWQEGGYTVQAESGPVVLVPSQAESDGTAGSGFLYPQNPKAGLVLRRASWESFRVLSLQLRALQPGRITKVRLEGVQPDRTVHLEVFLQGIPREAQGIPRFRTVFLPDDFSNLTELVIRGRDIAVDNIQCVTPKDLTVPVVRLLPLDPVGIQLPQWQDPILPDMCGPRVRIVRFGDLSQPLTCLLDLQGTAEYAQDYFIENLQPGNTIRFQPGQAVLDVTIRLLRPRSTSQKKTILIRLLPDSSYQLSIVHGALLTLYQDSFQGWVAKRWGLASLAEPIGAPDADPDRNGFSNFAEYALGMIPTDPSSLQRPWLKIEPDRSVSLFLPRARWLPKGFQFEVFSSENLQDWIPIFQSPAVTNGSETQDLLRYSMGLAEGKKFYRIVIKPSE